MIRLFWIGVSSLVTAFLIWDVVLVESWFPRIRVDGAIQDVGVYKIGPLGFVDRRKLLINVKSIGVPVRQYIGIPVDCTSSDCFVSSFVNGKLVHPFGQPVPSISTNDEQVLETNVREKGISIYTSGIHVEPGDEFRLEFRIVDDSDEVRTGSITVTFLRWYKIKSRFIGVSTNG